MNKIQTSNNKKTNKTISRKDQLTQNNAVDIQSDNMSQRTGESLAATKARHADQRNQLMKRNYNLSDTSDALADATDDEAVFNNQQ